MLTKPTTTGGGPLLDAAPGELLPLHAVTVELAATAAATAMPNVRPRSMSGRYRAASRFPEV
jgi:hypothetical protein